MQISILFSLKVNRKSTRFRTIANISEEFPILIIAVRKNNETRQKLLIKLKDSGFCRSLLEENKSPV